MTKRRLAAVKKSDDFGQNTLTQSTILLIEESSTLRHVLKKSISSLSPNIHVIDSYEEGLAEIKKLISRSNVSTGVIIGWPDQTNIHADEILVLLNNPQLEKLPVVLLSETAEPEKLDWITNHSSIALLPWTNYEDCCQVMMKLLDSSDETNEGTELHIEHQIRILFVDDSPTMRVGFRSLLSQHNYIVEAVASVHEAMQLATEQHFDIAIIDYFMPGGNGDVLVKQLKDNPDTNHIVPAIITGTYSDKVIRDCLDAGAVECVFKSEAEELFLARVRSLTRSVLDRKSIDNERKRLQRILASVGDGVYGVSKEGKIEFINPAAQRILGYQDQSQLINTSAYDLFHYKSEKNPSSEQDCFLYRCYSQGMQCVDWQTRFQHKNGYYVQVECTAYPMEVESEHVGSVVAFRDISDRKLLEEELRWQATHDPLTELYNRKYFEEQIAQEVKQLKRRDNYSALLLIDMDRFKYINDTAGHMAGDQLLIKIGKQLKKRLRSSDILARIGGDEYAIILRDMKDKNEISQAAEAFKQILSAEEFYFGGKSYVVTATMGVSVIDKNTKSVIEVMANADVACHIAKNSGRNQVYIYSADNDSKAEMSQDLGWSSRLNNALKNDLFVLNYQPIVSFDEISYEQDSDGKPWNQDQHQADGKELFCEVLLRLKGDDGQTISPKAFLPTAERFDLTRDIDRWVIKHAFINYQAESNNGHDIKLSINLSAHTLCEPDSAQYIKDQLKRYKVKPEKILFEITETQAVTNIDATRQLIQELRSLGCQFALDDFGSGFSSFSHLKHLDVDFIKIDGIFTQGLLQNKVDKAVIMATIEMAKALNKKTVVEFVDSVEIMDALKTSGVDYLQGFYLSEPLHNLVT